MILQTDVLSLHIKQIVHQMKTNCTIYIKNMVCDRCIMVVTDVLNRLGWTPVTVRLGQAELPDTPSASQYEQIRSALCALGFELIEDNHTRTAEHIKQLIINLIHRKNGSLKINLSQYLSDECRQDYSTLSKIFSEAQGCTIEKYFIAQRIERVKELLEYDELNLNEIADKLNYSSTAHLSTQFKMQTGLTPRQYKQQKKQSRMPLDKI